MSDSMLVKQLESELKWLEKEAANPSNSDKTRGKRGIEAGITRRRISALRKIEAQKAGDK